MDAVWLVFGAEFRRRWRSWLALAAPVAVVGGLSIGAVAAGNRSAGAFPSFVKRMASTGSSSPTSRYRNLLNCPRSLRSPLS